MKIWIPGGNGMLGSELQRQLKGSGHDVVVTGREVDVADAGVVGAFADVNRFDVVINCAGYTAVDKAEAEEDAATRVNGEAPGVLGAAAHKTGARVLHVSTDYVFDGTSKQSWLPDDATGPLSAYGRSKLAGERRLLEATDGKGLVVRTSWLFGHGGKNFVTTMLSLMAEREQLKVVADQHGRPTSTATLAATLLSLSTVAAGGVTHCADAEATTWHGFATAIADGARARGFPIQVRTIEAVPTSAYPTPARRPAWSVLDTTRTEQLIGRPLPPWRATLGRFLDELKAA
jgi:dTDP-4-dehydrorhamnose reductase